MGKNYKKVNDMAEGGAFFSAFLLPGVPDKLILPIQGTDILSSEFCCLLKRW